MNDYNKIININNKQNICIDKRNYGIDLLRIISMINIINLHINLTSGLNVMKPESKKYKSLWRLETMSFFGVNCFGLISGIVGFKHSKLSKLVYLWILVTFYSIFTSLYLYSIKQISISELLLSFCPILVRKHWYFNAYFSMYLYIPFINIGINNLNQFYFKNLVIFIILFSCFYDVVGKIVNKNNYHFLNFGYSSLWLITLYIIGAYIGKFVITNKRKINRFFLIFYILLYFSSSLLGSEIFFLTDNKVLISYLSPTILFEAISLIMIFSRLKIDIKWIKKTISFFSSLTFGIYLLHASEFPRQINIIGTVFGFSKRFQSNFIFFKVYGLSIIIFFALSIIDYLRAIIFKFLKIRNLSIILEKFLLNLRIRL